MLIERTFEIGGLLCWAMALLLGAALVVAGIVAIDPATIVVPILFAGIGSLFLAVGRQARRDRLALLDAPRPPGEAERRTLADPPK